MLIYGKFFDHGVAEQYWFAGHRSLKPEDTGNREIPLCPGEAPRRGTRKKDPDYHGTTLIPFLQFKPEKKVGIQVIYKKKNLKEFYPHPAGPEITERHMHLLTIGALQQVDEPVVLSDHELELSLRRINHHPELGILHLAGA